MNNTGLRLFAPIVPQSAAPRPSRSVFAAAPALGAAGFELFERTPIWSPPEPGVAGDQAAHRAEMQAPTRVELEDEILAALAVDRGPAETAAEVFARCEQRLARLFSRLSVQDARVLLRRLKRGDSSDPIVAGFAAMISERRGRLLQVLSDAPRRAALRSSGLRCV